MEEAFHTFPTNGILPKKETGALAFLSKYPEYDGSGVVIAILDTGVDPGAPGLQKTPDGRPKIIDLIDATGSGDVDISTVKEVDAEGFVTGLTGRKLKIPSTWSNPSGKFYCGYKAIYELYAEPLRDRIKKKRKETIWQANNDEAMAQVQQKLKDLNNAKSAPSNEVSSSSKTPEAGSKSSSSSSDELIKSLQKEDLQAQLECLKDLESKIKDVGPVYDCLVWSDAGSTWRACVVDASEEADLSKCKVLTTYRDSFEYATFGNEDMFNYSVTILENEKILQIVTDSGAHGTHVASIAAGYHPDQPELNGVAPGARIVGIKIGDIRVNGMETSFALNNACRYLIEHKCDLTNFSFGEPISFINSAPAMRIAEEMVEKYGIIFCGSAGNNGPGLQTVNAPASACRSAISVGAFVTSEMLKAEHSILGNGTGSLFSWSSRGPQYDGQHGVSICAPGGAFAAVPNWTQRGQQLMSGTSMSSPNLCGCLALLLSGLKKNGIEYTPYGVKRAIQNTALDVDEALGAGAGLIQVDKAYDYLVKYKDSIFQKVLFDVKITQGTKTMRGILLKNSDELTETRDYSVTIEPIFFEKPATGDVQTDQDALLKLQQEKISLSAKLALVCEPNASDWLEHPAHLYLVNSSRQFFVRIHGNRLKEDKAYFTQLKAFDVDDPSRSCLFRIPITVVKPHVFDKSNTKSSAGYELSFNNVSFKQGQVQRHFIRVPIGATHAELTLTTDESNSDRGHVPFFHVQCFTWDNFRNHLKTKKEDYYRLNTSNEFKHIFKTISNKIVQVAIGKNWSNVGSVVANYKIKFRGLLPSLSHEVYCLSSQPTRIEVASLLANEECDPSISWKFQVQPLKPTENQIELVKPGYGNLKAIYQIVLTYNFHQSKTEEVGCEVPLLSDYLYENDYQSVFWSIYESNTKRHMVSGDCFPVIYKYQKSIDKGDYVVRLHVRHNKIDMLEKLKELTINVRRSLSSQTANEICNSYINVLKGVKKTGAEKINKNGETTFFVTALQDDKLPKGVTAGQFLVGELTLFKDTAIGKIDNHKIYYQINAVASAKKDKSEKTASASKSTAAAKPIEESASTASLNTVAQGAEKAPKGDDDKIKDAIRDVQVSWVLKNNEIFDKIRNEYEGHIPLYVNRITYLQQKVSSAQDDAKQGYCDSIVELSKLAIGKINQDELLKYLGEKTHEGLSDEAKKEFDNQKNWMIELLVQQGIALIEKSSKDSADSSQDSAEIVAIYKSLQKFIDIADEKVSKFTLKFYLHQKLFGKALKTLFKQNDDKPATPSTEQSILDVLKQMKLDYAVKYHQNLLIVNSPKNYSAF